jgi:universal stress protein E
MDKIESILVAVDRSDKALPAFARAVAMARHCGARLELFLCDAEGAYALKHEYDLSATAAAESQSRAESRRFLESLATSVGCADVDVTFDVMCESPLYEGIVHKVQRWHPDLVIRAIGDHSAVTPGALSATDWDLVRTCPVPLMLTRGHAWLAPRRIAAAVDVADEPALSREIVHTAAWLAARCDGVLEILNGDSNATAGAAMIDSRRALLRQLAAGAAVQPQQLHVVAGDPVTALPAFAAGRHYDLFVLGALTHRKALTALVGTFTGRVIQALSCDFLLVKPQTFVCPVTPSA